MNEPEPRSEASAEARLDALEERLRRIEDELAITRLVLTYGPAVDSGSDTRAAELWTEDGSYEFEAGVPALHGRDGIAAMVRSAGHRAHLERGCAHVLTAPQVRIVGDRAVAVCYSLMHHHVPERGRFQVSRVSANRWDLVRTPEGWRVSSRTNRLLNGQADARSLFAEAIRDAEGAG